MSIKNTSIKVIKEHSKELSFWFIDQILIASEKPEYIAIGIGLKSFISLVFGVTEEKTQELDEFFKNNKELLTEELITSSNFKTGLANFLRDYFTEINSNKRTIARKIFFDFIEEKDKENWELNRKLNTLSSLSLESIKFLHFISINIPSALIDEQHKPSLSDGINSFYLDNTNIRDFRNFYGNMHELLYELIANNLASLLDFKPLYDGLTPLNVKFTKYGIEFINFIKNENFEEFGAEGQT